MAKAQRKNGHTIMAQKAGVVHIPTRKSTIKQGSSFTTDGKPSHLTIKKTSLPKKLRGVRKDSKKKVTYIFDTNVLIFDPHSCLKFDEHKIVIPNKVLQELDKLKTSPNRDVAKSARDVVSYLSDQTDHKTTDQIKKGVTLKLPDGYADDRQHTGKLFLDMSMPKVPNPDKWNVAWDHSSNDHKILMSCISYIDAGEYVILVTRDLNLRLMAKAIGIQAEDYLNAVIAEEEQRTGYYTMQDDFWEKIGGNFESSHVSGEDEYFFNHPMFRRVVKNEIIIFPEGDEFQVIEKPSPHKLRVRRFKALKCPSKNFKFKEVAQGYAYHHILDPKIEAVSIAGQAGSGKTITAMSAAFDLVCELKSFDRVIYIQPSIGPADDIGFLPGTEEEKMAPWSEAIDDSLEMLFGLDQVEHIKEKMNLQLKALGLIRGRSFGKGVVVILDEAQNATSGQVKAVLSRMCKGSKLIICGNVGQVDHGKLTVINCGISVIIRKFFDIDEYAHISLSECHRNAIAAAAEDRL